MAREGLDCLSKAIVQERVEVKKKEKREGEGGLRRAQGGNNRSTRLAAGRRLRPRGEEDRSWGTAGGWTANGEQGSKTPRPCKQDAYHTKPTESEDGRSFIGLNPPPPPARSPACTHWRCTPFDGVTCTDCRPSIHQIQPTLDLSPLVEQGGPCMLRPRFPRLWPVSYGCGIANWAAMPNRHVSSYEYRQLSEARF